MAGGPLPGRYRTVRVLRQEGGVLTALAREAPEGREVVVKRYAGGVLPRAVVSRLERESAVLAALDIGPPVPSVAHEGDAVLVVRRFVPGRPLPEWLGRRRLDAQAFLALARDVLASLTHIHAAGVLHRDVVPGNVIVEGRSGARAVLVDIGLAPHERREAQGGAPSAAAAAYLSPEAAGLLAAEPDERSDLYAAGVVLYEALTGRLPFAGTTAGAVLRAHLSERPPRLRRLGVEVPPVVEEILGRLLRADPVDRYQTASGALADVEEAVAALAAGEEERVAVGARDPRTRLTDPAFIVRSGEVAALGGHLQRARAGEGALVLMEAPSGGGKTRVLDEVAARWDGEDAWVLRGQAVDQAARHPFQVLAGVAREVVQAARSDASLAGRLADGLAGRTAAVRDALPEVGALLGAPEGMPAGPEEHATTRIVEALGALVDSLGAPGRPAVLLLDDLQWADDETIALLRHWAGRRSRADGVHALVVGAFRSEEVGHGHPLQDVPADARIALAPLRPADVQRMAASMAGPLPAEAVAAVTELASGNPFMVSATLRGLVESGALVTGLAGWRVEESAMADVRSSGEAAAVLARRLELLPPRVSALLAAGAVLGKEFDLPLAAELAGQTGHAAASLAAEARRRHIVWQREGERWSFVHDKLREGMLAGLAPEDRSALHLRAADRLEHREPAPVFDLAYHYDAGGRPERARHYALAAAEAARAQHAIEAAERYYRIAERGQPGADPAERLRIMRGLGEVLMLRGRYDEAGAAFAGARPWARGAMEEAELESLRGELAFKRGDVTTATEALERALRVLGWRVPARRPAVVSMAGWEVVVQALHTALPGLFLARRALEGAERERLAMRIHSRLAYAYWFERGAVPCLWAHVREMNLAERYEPTPELAQAYSEHAPVMTMIPRYARGVAYAERSLAIRRELRDPWGEGQSLHFYGVVLYASSRFHECIERCATAVRLLEHTGDRWEVNTARWHIAYSRYRLGDLRGAAELAAEVHRDALAIGDHQSAAIALSVWSKATGGAVPEDLIAAALARDDGDVHKRAELLQAEAVRLLGDGRPGPAAEVLREADRIVRDAGMRQEYVAPVLPWLATALRRDLESSAAAPSRRRLREARSAARRAARVARAFPNNQPHALRERALIEALAGRPRRARALLGRSIAAAERQGAEHELALSLAARGRLGAELGWEGAGDDTARAARLPGAFGPGADAVAEDEAAAAPVPVTLSLADRFAAVVDAGRRVASALDPQAVHAAVESAARELLRGEECRVIALDEDTTTAPEGDEAPAEALLRAMAERVARSGRPLIAGGRGDADEPLQRLAAAAGARSALCAPILVRGAPAAVLHVTHGRVEDLFGAEEARLAEYIAALAGTAMENADGFTRAQALSRSLEHRVAERTAQLAEANRRLDENMRTLEAAYRREVEVRNQLEHRALHDALTNLANRRLFANRVEQALARRGRRPVSCAVLFLDVDDFKTVNDSLGHAAGDRLLVEIARRLRENLRSPDTAARLGGDEFAVLLEDLSAPAEAAEVAERLLTALSAPLLLQGREVFAHASIGIAVPESAAQPAEELLRNADVAMYRAKSGGKGRYQFFEQRMHTAVVEGLELRASLQRAVAEDELVLHYQPIVDLADGRVASIEALVRWRRPDGSLMGPSGFIPFAEESGLIIEIGRWVLAQACAQARRMEGGPWGAPDVSVNLSTRQLSHPGLVGEVAASLEEAGLPPSRLILEITESVLMREGDPSIARLEELRSLGVRLAIDDFGTGYSSLGYLGRLPLDQVKIAKEFVDRVDDPSGPDFAAAIVALARSCGLRSVAEGVERGSQRARLLEMGCDMGQGFLFARPVPEGELPGALDRGSARDP